MGTPEAIRQTRTEMGCRRATNTSETSLELGRRTKQSSMRQEVLGQQELKFYKLRAT